MNTGASITIRVVRIAVGVFLLLSLLLWFMAQPTRVRNNPSAFHVDPDRLREHVVMLAEAFHPRDWQHPHNLDQCADYIAGHLRAAGARVDMQEFDVLGRRYRNVVGRMGPGTGPVVVIGAHYDAHAGTPGADDNASGVSALIELAYLLGRHAPPQADFEFVAYTLEEPPFFRTPFMGSAIHARRLAESDAAVTGVIVLEMVGYFSDEPWSQSYPALLFRLFYPSRGNFIAVVGRWDQGGWIKRVKTGMKGASALPVYSVRAPAIVPGVDFSDHRNYWPFGMPALMITDTAFYRNRAYHTPEDTADRLDYNRMAQVVVALGEAVLGLRGPEQ